MVGSKPGWTASNRSRLLNRSPAPTNNTNARLISAATSAPRIRWCATPVVAALVPSFKPSARSTRDADSAGSNPHRTPVITEAARLKPNTVASRERSLACGRRAASRFFTSEIPQPASANPALPPTRERIRLSVSNCRINRARPAPSASRTPISRCRTVERASSRFATLRQAISRTNATTTIRILSGCEY